MPCTRDVVYNCQVNPNELHAMLSLEHFLQSTLQQRVNLLKGVFVLVQQPEKKRGGANGLGFRLRQIVATRLPAGPDWLSGTRLEFADGGWGRVSQVEELDWSNQELGEVSVGAV